MFEDMVISSPHPTKTNKTWTVVVSMVAQSIFLAILILIPLIYTEALPKTLMATLLVAQPPPPPKSLTWERRAQSGPMGRACPRRESR